MNNSTTKNGVFFGLLSGILWGLDTVLIGVILASSSFNSFIALAPIIATFFHDAFSSMWMLLLNISLKQIKNLLKSFKQVDSYIVLLAAVLGGPIGMTGYMLAIYYIGPTYTAIISSMYPAIGVLISRILLKERLTKKIVLGLSIAIFSTMLLGLSSTESTIHSALGFAFAFLCVIGWGCESVICSIGMRKDITPSIALQLRQTMSFLVLAVVIIPFIDGYQFVSIIAKSNIIWLLCITALAGSISYLFYYSSIKRIGPIRAMGLNISYSAWALFIGLLFGYTMNFIDLLLALSIITGSILTTDQPKEFFKLLIFKT